MPPLLFLLPKQMSRPWRRWVAIAVTLMATGPALCGPFEEGIAVLDKGDYASAYIAFKPLAVSGDARSQFQLSLLYASGRGVSANPAEALRWLQQAAVRGHAQAQSNLGNAFHAGRVVPLDLLKTYAWLNMAVNTGDRVAITNRDVVARKLTPKQVEAADALARKCLSENFKHCL